jgi:hypothetical protein
MSYEELQGLSPGDKTLVTSTVDCATDVHVGFSQVNDYCSGLLTQAAIRDLRARGGWLNNFAAWYSDNSGAITATVGLGGAGYGLYKSGMANASAAESIPIAKPYARPNGATTGAQRASVQGKPCVDCKVVETVQYADHVEPLVVEYYRTGTIDVVRMRSIEAVQPSAQVAPIGRVPT